MADPPNQAGEEGRRVKFDVKEPEISVQEDLDREETRSRSRISDTSWEQWHVNSWRSFPIRQQPLYGDQDKLKEVVHSLSRLPGLVHPSEIQQLRRELVEVSEGKRFLMIGGDCAERFLDCNSETIEIKLKIILQMSLILISQGGVPVTRCMRIAGQYGKPRSSPYEKLPDGRQVMSFKGDNVNSIEVDRRQPEPKRLMTGYFFSAATLNYIRAISASGFADLHNANHWQLDYINSKKARAKYQAITNRLLDSLAFMDTVGGQHSETHGVNMYTAHEALILDFESAMTRKYEDNFYNTSCHFCWIGDRTRQLNGAHVEYFRGIENPVGIKVGPSSDPLEICEVVKVVNPTNEIGKVVLITRFGAERVRELLPAVILVVQEAELNVIWQCDPMHGNTRKTKGGVKTRSFNVILEELQTTFHVHRECGSRLHGVHFELTGENVTECTGGPQHIRDHQLNQNYKSYCDPRLNYQQSMEIAFKLGELLNEDMSAREEEPLKCDYGPDTPAYVWNFDPSEI